MERAGVTWTPGQQFQDDIVYGVEFEGQPMLLITRNTWEKQGTTYMSLRNVCAAQDKRIKELLAQLKDHKTVNDDLAERLNNLRANHRLLIEQKVREQLGDLGVLTDGPKETPK